MTPFSPPVQAVLELFKGPLSTVRFADVDAAVLSNAAAQVASAAAEVEACEAQLAERKQGLAERQDALLVVAQRALAYARVFAEGDDALLEELNRIALPRASKPRKAGTTKVPTAGDSRMEPSVQPRAAEARESSEPAELQSEMESEASSSAEGEAGSSADSNEPVAAPTRPARKIKARASRTLTEEDSA
ncbi:MAG: hypothetical protein ABW061_01880 [Polyangiaceae bacterium]